MPIICSACSQHKHICITIHNRYTSCKENHQTATHKKSAYQFDLNEVKIVIIFSYFLCKTVYCKDQKVNFVRKGDSPARFQKE